MAQRALKQLKQRVLSYFAVFEPEVGSGYTVTFPDFPGCVTFGRTFEEAKKMAKEVLELWLEDLVVNRGEIPEAPHRPIIDEITVSAPAMGRA